VPVPVSVSVCTRARAARGRTLLFGGWGKDGGGGGGACELGGEPVIRGEGSEFREEWTRGAPGFLSGGEVGRRGRVPFRGRASAAAKGNSDAPARPAPPRVLFPSSASLSRPVDDAAPALACLPPGFGCPPVATSAALAETAKEREQHGALRATHGLWVRPQLLRLGSREPAHGAGCRGVGWSRLV